MVHFVRLRFYTKSGRQVTRRIRINEVHLNLSSHGIVSIDLTPLEYCRELRHIDLSENDIQRIDLNPLCVFQNFFSLDLSNNNLESLNITPLLFCNNLTHLIVKNAISYEIDPIGQHAIGNYAILNAISRVRLYKSYDELVVRDGWKTILSHTKEFLRLLPERQWFAAQRGLLTGMGFPELAAFDGWPYLLLENITDDMDYEQAKLQIEENTIRLLKSQIENQGSTHFLDIDRLSSTSGAILISPILENRMKEMQDLKIERINGKVDGRVFFFTHYGRQILTEMGYRPVSNQTIRVNDILKVMKETGFEPEVIDLNEEPRKYVWERFSLGLTTFLEHAARGNSLVSDIVSGEDFYQLRQTN